MKDLKLPNLLQLSSRQPASNLIALALTMLMLCVYNTWAAPDSAPATAPADPSVTPGLLSYQGYLTDASGSPLNGNMNVTFRLYNVLSGGTALWTEAHTGGNAVPVSNGLFNVLLGSLTPIPASVWNNDMVYLGIRVGNDAEMAPRELIGGVPLASTVPNGSVTTAKLNIDGDLDIQGHRIVNAPYMSTSSNAVEFHNFTGSWRASAGTGMALWIDSDNNSTDDRFTINRDDTHFGDTSREIWGVREDGRVEMYGDLDMNGNSIINQGAMVEANLQTPDELAAERIPRFSEGDALCWGEGRLELCAQLCDPLIQAVADENGKPIIIGAEAIKVIGPVQRGDLLVASEVPGYATVWSSELHPPAGSVIAQALEVFDGGRGMIKAMIRKF